MMAANIRGSLESAWRNQNRRFIQPISNMADPCKARSLARVRVRTGLAHRGWDSTHSDRSPGVGLPRPPRRRGYGLLRRPPARRDRAVGPLACMVSVGARSETGPDLHDLLGDPVAHGVRAAGLARVRPDDRRPCPGWGRRRDDLRWIGVVRRNDGRFHRGSTRSCNHESQTLKKTNYVIAVGRFAGASPAWRRQE